MESQRHALLAVEARNIRPIQTSEVSDLDGYQRSLVEDTFAFLVEAEIKEFLANLETARGMWRRYRDFVEAPEPIDLLRSFSLVSKTKFELEDVEVLGIAGELLFEEDFREKLLSKIRLHVIEATRLPEKGQGLQLLKGRR